MSRFLSNPIAKILISNYSDFYRKHEGVEIKKSHLGFVFPRILYAAILILSILPMLILLAFSPSEALFFPLILSVSFFFLLIFSLIYKSITSVKKLDTFLTGTPVIGRYVSSKIGVLGYLRYVTYIDVDSCNGKMMVVESVIHKYGHYHLLLKKKMVTGKIRVMLPLEQARTNKYFVSELGDDVPALIDEHPEHFFSKGEVRAFRR